MLIVPSLIHHIKCEVFDLSLGLMVCIIFRVFPFAQSRCRQQQTRLRAAAVPEFNVDLVSSPQYDRQFLMAPASDGGEQWPSHVHQVRS